jgi:D-3-phosphoglycerate dehydrogenase
VGISLWNKTAGVVGFGDVGRNTVKRLLAHDLEVTVFDPFVSAKDVPEGVTLGIRPVVEDLDFLIFTAPLTPETHHMFNENVLARTKPGLRLVNVGRGPVIQQTAVLAGLDNGHIHSAALDVFEVEPLSRDNSLHAYGTQCLFGSHNGSNTQDAVTAVSLKVVGLLAEFLA